MSPLESRIRNLQLHTPGESLDARITSVLSANAQRNPLSSEYVQPQETDSAGPSSRWMASGTGAGTSWLPVCASLLIGTVTGYWLLPDPFDQRSGRSTTASMAPTAEGVSAGQGTIASPEASGTRLSAIQNSSDATERSQIVESNWLSPAAAAVAWEQQTGQIFNVVNHVNDRRFDMCRDCHRVGG